MNVLAGTTVLDFGSFITAPLAAMLLADLGADVIKVETIEGGDPFRQFAGGHYSPHFQAHNRNKRSIALDLRQPEGVAVASRLAARADVLIFNMRPGAADRLGIGWEAMHRDNPALVYCAITGFGETGPYASRPAFDNVGQAIAGWSSRHRVGDDARVVGPAVSDAATAYYAAIGVLGALLERHRTGQGRRVDVSMLEATMGLATEALGQYLAADKPVPVYQRGAMSQAYTVTCADGLRIGLHLSSPDKFWQQLCEALGEPELAQEYATRQQRVAAYDALASRLDASFRRHPRAHWLSVLARYDVPHAAENELQDLPDDPQVRHLGLFQELTHPRHGRLRAMRRPLRIDGQREISSKPPPVLGEHTVEVLREAGLSHGDIEGLQQRAVVAQA